MANKIQLKRGLKSKLPTLSQGEPAYTTDTREFFMGTGSGNVNMGGSQWYTGTAMSGTSASTTYYYSACPQVKAGDMFLNTSNGNVYQCTTAGSGTTARWTYKGNLKGATGATGATGAKGDKGDSISSDIYKRILSKTLESLLILDVKSLNVYVEKQYKEIKLNTPYLIDFHGWNQEGSDNITDEDGNVWFSYNKNGNTPNSFVSNTYIVKFVEDSDKRKCILYEAIDD